MTELLTGWLVGLTLGIRHACEPDHLTAVCTLVTDRGGARRGLWLGAVWGLGHTLALLVVGMLLSLLQAEMPPRLARGFELAVAVMLVALGVRAIVRPAARVVAAPVERQQRRRMALRSLVVGIVHGLAGSGALTALVLAELPSASARLAYVVLFGCGSMLGMALLSGLAGWPLARLGRDPRVATVLAVTAGTLSIAFGVVWAVHLAGEWRGV